MSIKCPEKCCHGKVFRTAAGLAQHKKALAWHETRCTACQRVFGSNDALSQVRKRSFPLCERLKQGKKHCVAKHAIKYRCRTCSQAFMYREHFWSHKCPPPPSREGQAGSEKANIGDNEDVVMGDGEDMDVDMG